MPEPIPHTIAVIGAGNVGTQLARGFLHAGHVVRLGVRDPEGDSRAELRSEFGGAVTDPTSAVTGADLVVLATPALAVTDTAVVLGPLAGITVVDATNAVGIAVPDGHATMGDLVAATFPAAHVVKAFNTIGAEHLAGPALSGDPAPPVLTVAGHDAGRPMVVALAEQMGFDVADLGGPEMFALAEATAQLWIHLAFRRGWGRDFSFTVQRRNVPPTT